MNSGLKKDLRVLVHPYVFVLQEGPKITKDYLNYSLMMLQVGCPQTLRSPDNGRPRRNPLIAELDVIGQSFPPQGLKK